MTHQRTFQNILVLCSDILALYVSIICAFYTRALLEGCFSLVPLGHGLSLYLSKWWVIAVVMILIAYYGGYGITINFWDDFLVLIRSFFVSFLIVWVLLSLQKEAETVSRIIITISFMYMVAVVPCCRFLLKFLLFRLCDIRGNACLLGEPGEKELEIVKTLNSEWYSGYKIVEVIRIGSVTKAYTTCFVPLRYADEELIKNIKSIFKNLILISELSGLSFMNTEIKTFLSKNILLITTDSGLLSVQKMVFKRVFDIVLSLCSIIIFLPLLIVIPIIIKLDSRGPVFFTHRRVGKNLKEFTMLKYRTMHAFSERVIEEFLITHPEAYKELQERNKIKEDPRVTRFGKILRKTSLDELPQLFNVLKGDMSIVGPRPDAKEAVENFLSEYKRIYMRVRPGITGLWQVSGRSEIVYKERVKLDYLYVLNWSVWLDFVIILKTFYTILSVRGAY